LEDIDEYRQSGSQYKQLVIRKRKVYIERIQEAIIEGRDRPLQSDMPPSTKFQPSISTDTWEAHISRITCAKGLRPSIRPPDKTEPLVRITEEEVIMATKEAGRKRARGQMESEMSTLKKL